MYRSTTTADCNEVVYSPDMPKDARVDAILVALARIEAYIVFGGVIAVAFGGWLSWLTNKVVSGPVSLASIAVSPVNQKTVKQAGQIVSAALKSKDRQRLSSDVVRGIGQNMITASAGSNAVLAREAWSTAIQLMDYRSLLNADLNPIPPTAVTRKISYGFLFELAFVYPHGGQVGDIVKNIYTAGDDVPLEQAARLENLGSTANIGRALGPRVIIVEYPNNTIKLDDCWYKNVIVMNTKVGYFGGRMKLENVYFINCEFQMENASPSRAFGERMVAGAAVSFDGTLVAQNRIGGYAVTKSARLQTRSVIPAAMAGVILMVR